MVRTIFDLAKINTVPCICTVAPYLGKQVDNWLHSLIFVERITGAYIQ